MNHMFIPLSGLIGSAFAMKSQKKSAETESTARIVPVVQEGMIADFITGQPVKQSDKEKVRQEVARQLIFEYQIAPESMEADFPVKVEGKRKKVDIAIFEAGKEH